MADRVIVGLSGGVDSSVAALLLKEQGYDVECLFMKNWDDPDSEYCTTEQDYKDAVRVSHAIGVPLHTVNFVDEYREKVFSYFLEEYKAGRTPNPDVVCNKEIKFKVFLDYAIELGADIIATGHYANRSGGNGSAKLLKGLDSNKDQSYFLYALNQKQLSKATFPLGRITKQDVRSIAERHRLHTHDKKDSTGICFIGEQRHFISFLKKYFPDNPGDIRTVDGKICGSHDGLLFYTIGQRKGLGIGGVHGSENLPWYVADKDHNKNDLIVVQGRGHPSLYASGLTANQLHWISEKPTEIPASLHAKVRYRQKDEKCIIESIDDDTATVSFEKPVFAVTPGQSVVFYDGEICLGGAVIESAIE